MPQIRNKIDKNHGKLFGRGNTSRYPGVSWDKAKKKWFAGITIKGKTVYLGRYTRQLDAYKAYKAKLKEIS